jgi:hypothetical protein
MFQPDKDDQHRHRNNKKQRRLMLQLDAHDRNRRQHNNKKIRLLFQPTAHDQEEHIPLMFQLGAHYRNPHNQASQGPVQGAMNRSRRSLPLKGIQKPERPVGVSLVQHKGNTNRPNATKLNRERPARARCPLFYPLKGSELPPQDASPQGGPRGGPFL